MEVRMKNVELRIMKYVRIQFIVLAESDFYDNSRT